jgi:hypothetical protein
MVAHMYSTTRASLATEQCRVLWTWLLEGEVPVAHIVADLDELEQVACNDTADASSGSARYAHARRTPMEAA